MLRWISIGLTVSLFACGGEAPSTIDDPAPATDLTQVQTGIARLSLETSDCPYDSAGSVFTQAGTVRVEAGMIEVGLENMPLLSGRVRANHADISGITTFMSLDEEVTCAVAGIAELRSNLVTAQVSETLVSESALNCVQNWDVEISF